MKRRAAVIAACLLSIVATRTHTQTPSPTASSLVERVGDHGFVQLQSPSFGRLPPRQQALAYWLSQASIAIDPIIYDQLSQFGVRQKRLLEEIVAHPAGIAPDALAKIRGYALLFWANRGNHNDYTAQKFLPTFTIDELRQAGARAQASGAFKTAYADLPALPTADAVAKEIDALRAAFFDASFEPMVTTKSPPAGRDIIQASANTFYRGVTLDEMKSFRERYALNSRVVKGSDGTIREEVYRAGTPDGKCRPGSTRST
jgi:dipeptidyl-peptidase-3